MENWILVVTCKAAKFFPDSWSFSAFGADDYDLGGKSRLHNCNSVVGEFSIPFTAIGDAPAGPMELLFTKGNGEYVKLKVVATGVEIESTEAKRIERNELFVKIGDVIPEGKVVAVGVGFVEVVKPMLTFRFGSSIDFEYADIEPKNMAAHEDIAPDAVVPAKP